MLKTVLASVALAGLVAGVALVKATEPIQPVATDLPAGTYRLDPAHTSLIFKVSHLGFSNYTARFTRMTGELVLDPADPGAATLTASVDPLSLDTGNEDPTYDFDAQLQGPEFLDAAIHPQITFHSTEVKLTGPDTAQVTGALELHGVTLPVTLETRFNGGYASHPLDPGGARIGFSATGSLLRSAFGMGFGVPPEGSTMGVGDLVEFAIETEFLRPKEP